MALTFFVSVAVLAQACSGAGASHPVLRRSFLVNYRTARAVPLLITGRLALYGY